MLTATEAKQAQPREKDYKLFDEKGLFLLVKKNGSKYWRFKYRFNGKEKLLAIGVYPEITLAHARKERDEARVKIRNGIDPSAAKQPAGDTFEAIAREWLRCRGKKSETGDARLITILEKDLLPTLGHRTAKDITPPDLLATIRLIERRGAIETGRRANQYAGQIFRFGIASGKCDRDPSQDIKDALAKRETGHFSAIIEPTEFGQLLNAIDVYHGSPIVCAALKLSPLVLLRPGEVRHLEWQEINWQDEQIEIPAEKMKMGEPHIVPLSKQALSILEALNELHRRSDYVFYSARGASRPLSENAIRVALRTMGYTNEQMTAHGFRASARTMLDEQLEYPVSWIEQQLAHSVRDANGRAYNRTKHLRQRRDMLQAWADYCDEIKKK